MTLFNVDIPHNADRGYLNIRGRTFPAERHIYRQLEDLWRIYEPFADANFRTAFAIEPDQRFWEMYLGVTLLHAQKPLIERYRREEGNFGPDLCIAEPERKIWIEAIAPDIGQASNPDRVPRIVPLSEGGQLTAAPRNQVELRITSALETKRRQFSTYTDRGIIGEADVCLIAVSGSRFFAEASTTGFPRAVTAVYPIGETYMTFGDDANEQGELRHHSSYGIRRSVGDEIPRSAFLNERYCQISGMIWSRRTIGSFNNRVDDFTFVHNFAANNSLPHRWGPWTVEYAVREDGDSLTLEEIGSV